MSQKGQWGGTEKEEVGSLGALGTGNALQNEETWFGQRLCFFYHLVKEMNIKSPLFPQVHSASKCKLPHLWYLDLDFLKRPQPMAGYDLFYFAFSSCCQCDDAKYYAGQGKCVTLWEFA